jgi:hypothetical protein
MLNQLLGHTWHIRWFPHEYITVSPRKLMSALSYFSLKPPPIKAVLDESPSCSWMALMLMLLGLGFTLN